MRIVYFEPFSGISGDMVLGALLDLGLELETLQQQLNALPFEDYGLSSRRCSKAGIRAIKFDVNDRTGAGEVSSGSSLAHELPRNPEHDSVEPAFGLG